MQWEKDIHHILLSLTGNLWNPYTSQYRRKYVIYVSQLVYICFFLVAGTYRSTDTWNEVPRGKDHGIGVKVEQPQVRSCNFT